MGLITERTGQKKELINLKIKHWKWQNLNEREKTDWGKTKTKTQPRKEGTLSDPWDYTKWCSICVIKVPKRLKESRWDLKSTHRNNGENSSNLAKSINLQSQESEQIPSRINPKIYTKKHHSQSSETKDIEKKSWKQQERKSISPTGAKQFHLLWISVLEPWRLEGSDTHLTSAERKERPVQNPISSTNTF